jgi:hypothetical protein
VRPAGAADAHQHASSAAAARCEASARGCGFCNQVPRSKDTEDMLVWPLESPGPWPPARQSGLRRRPKARFETAKEGAGDDGRGHQQGHLARPARGSRFMTTVNSVSVAVLPAC